MSGSLKLQCRYYEENESRGPRDLRRQVRRGLHGFILDGKTLKPIRNANFRIAGAEGGKVDRS